MCPRRSQAIDLHAAHATFLTPLAGQEVGSLNVRATHGEGILITGSGGSDDVESEIAHAG
jgi:hypothetical protein